MTKLLDMAIEAASQLSPEEQDELAYLIMEIVNSGEEDVHILSEEENAAIARSRAAAQRGEMASDDQVKALLAKYTR